MILVEVPKPELLALWDRFGLTDCYDSGLLDEECLYEKRSGDPRLRAFGARGRVINLYTRGDHRHIATIQRTVARDGTLLDWHPISYVDGYGTKWQRPDRGRRRAAGHAA